jgi:hypothetical protein
MKERRGYPRHSSHSLPVRAAHRLFLHGPHKAVAITSTALDKPLHPAAVANSPTGQCHATFERRITDELAGPYLRAELVFGDHVVTLFEEILQHLKRFGPQPDRGTLPVQRIEAGVEDTLSEDIAHTTHPPCSAGRQPAGRYVDAGQERLRIPQYTKRMHEQYRRNIAAIAQVDVRFPGGKWSMLLEAGSLKRRAPGCGR